MREEDTEEKSKWQPVLMMLRGGGRLECRCGALAVIVIAFLQEKRDDLLEEVDYWCQACYLKTQQEENDDRMA